MTKRRLSRGEGTKGGEGKKAEMDRKRFCKDGQRRRSHGKKQSSHFPWSNQPSFMKLMIGSFEEVLFIPPKFANKLDGLVYQHVHLEDFWGRLSKVEVSRVDGSLAFQEGWPDFVTDHSISNGELLVFKYVSRTLFNVQIFGNSACERISFVEEGRSNLSITGTKIREDDYVVNAIKNDPENIPQHYHDYWTGNIVDVIETTGSPSNTVDGEDLAGDILLPLSTTGKGLSGEQEKNSIQMLGTRGDQTLEEMETLLIPSEEVVCKFLITEEGVCHLINHDFEEKFTASIMTPTGLASSELDYVVNTIKNDPENIPQHYHDYRAGNIVDVIETTGSPSNTVNGEDLAGDILLPLSTTGKGLSGEQEKNSIQMLGMRGNQTLEEMETLLIPSEVVCKFLITEEGVCHLINHDFEEKVTASIMTPAGLPSSELATCISCNNIVPVVQYTSCLAIIPEVNCLSSKVDNLEDEPGKCMHANQENGHFLGFFSLVSGVESVEEDLLAVRTTKGNTCQPREDDPSPHDSFCSSIILSSNPMCWLELPQNLPIWKGQRKQKSKIVLLQDPSHRRWPVMYMESFEFMGFSSGWENFATANNLKQGDTCEFFYEAGNDSLKKFAEGTDVFRVQISHAHLL